MPCSQCGQVGHNIRRCYNFMAAIDPYILSTEYISPLTSIFSELPNSLIISIIQIENDRMKREKERRKYQEVIKQLKKVFTFGGFDDFDVFDVIRWYDVIDRDTRIYIDI